MPKSEQSVNLAGKWDREFMPTKCGETGTSGSFRLGEDSTARMPGSEAVPRKTEIRLDKQGVGVVQTRCLFSDPWIWSSAPAAGISKTPTLDALRREPLAVEVAYRPIVCTLRCPLIRQVRIRGADGDFAYAGLHVPDRHRMREAVDPAGPALTQPHGSLFRHRLMEHDVRSRRQPLPTTLPTSTFVTTPRTGVVPSSMFVVSGVRRVSCKFAKPVGMRCLHGIGHFDQYRVAAIRRDPTVDDLRRLVDGRFNA